MQFEFFFRGKNRVCSIFIAFILISSSCGLDKEGDAIATMNKSVYPETYEVLKNEILAMRGLSGPTYLSDMSSRIPTSLNAYSQGGSSRMAVLITDTTSAWLGLVHGLKTIGVPFILTTDYQRALQHKVVFVYPILSGATLSPDASKALAEFPRNGGTLISTNVLGALNEVFGFDDPLPSKQHFEVIMQNDSNELTLEFSEKMEHKISLGNKKLFKETIGTYSYTKPMLPPLALYEDRSAAITQRLYQGGRAIAIGFDIGFLILKSHNNRHDEFNRTTYNSFEPTVDVVLRFIRNIYLTGEKNSVILQTVPYDKQLSVVITHNVDYANNLQGALEFSEEEKKLSLHSTYFIQTKYIKDQQQRIFNSSEDFKKLNTLAANGHEMASNTVSGSPQFDQFDQGTGLEKYPSYKPYLLAYDKTYHGSIFGEMRISKFLIDTFIPEQSVLSFRSNHTYAPYSLPQSMIATGYRFSSTVPANTVLSHFPLRLNYNKEFECETDMYEFPVTDDDGIPPFNIGRENQAFALAKQISKYGGCYIAQWHPTQRNLIFLKKFVNELKNDAWFGSLRDFAQWWIARDLVGIDVEGMVGNRRVILNVPKRMEGLALRLPWRSSVKSVTGTTNYFDDGRQIIFEIAEGTIVIELNN